VTQFVVSLPCPERALSPNAHIHWRDKAAATKVARKQSWYWFQRHKPRKWKVGPIILEIEYRYGIGMRDYKPRDVQNAIAALKPCLDGMVDAGVVPDDSHEWVNFGRVRIVKCIQGEQPAVVITVRLDERDTGIASRASA
jgi:crossover junction endodeoxyribonuclease RusA